MIKALLIDADSFVDAHLPDEVLDAIENGFKVISSQGTKLENELKGANKKYFSELKKAARILEFCADSVKKKTRQMKILEGEREILSNNTAVLAGAIVSRANTLITKDDKLKKDFKKCASINRNTSCKHRIALAANANRKVITPPHEAGPKRSRKGTSKKKVRELLAEASCSPVSCNCINGCPTC